MTPDAVPTETASAFRDTLAALDLVGVDRILDVGAGGFLGETTTIYLLELFPDAEIWAAELNPQRATELQEKFGDRIHVVAGDVKELEAEPFDLVILDLDSTRIPMLFEDLLRGKVLELTTPESVVVNVFFTDVLNAFSAPRHLGPAGAEAAADFMLRYFGRLRISDTVAKARFADDPDYRALVLVEKFRDDPHPSVGWLVLERHTDGDDDTEAQLAEDVQRLDPETVRLAATGSLVALDLVGDPAECDPTCAALVRQWSDWARNAFEGSLPADAVLDDATATFMESPAAAGELIVAVLPLALLDTTGGEDEYLASIGAKSRNMLRKVERLGYTFRVFAHDDHLDDIHQINTSKPERSGRPMEAGYLTRPTPIGMQVEGCSQHRKVYIGAFAENRLWAYCQLVILNELAVINRFLGHGARLKDGVMNGLVAATRDYCAGEGTIRALNYLTLRSSTDELDRFKRSTGFSAHAVLFNACPAASVEVTA